MKWEEITLEQYQAIAKIINSDQEDIYKEIGIVALMDNLTENEINRLSISDFNKKKNAAIALLNSPIPGKAKDYIKANGKTYKINYRIEKQRFGQYIETQSFGNDVDKLHLLMASIVNPVSFRFGIRRVGRNDSKKHEDVANDMLQARYIDVYNASVFFWRLWRGSINLMEGYLVSKMTEQGMKEAQAKELLRNSLKGMDGFITPNWLPTLRVWA